MVREQTLQLADVRGSADIIFTYFTHIVAHISRLDITN